MLSPLTDKYINLALHEVSLTSRNTKSKAICKDLMCEVFVFFAINGVGIVKAPLFYWSEYKNPKKHEMW